MPINSALAQAILNQQVPDVLGNFQAGREQQRQTRSRELQGQALQGQEGALQELQGLDPSAASALAQHIGASNQRDLNSFIQDARIGEKLLSQGNIEGFLAFSGGREADIRRRGGNTEQTSRISSLVRQGKVEEARREMQAFNEAVGNAKKVSQRAFQPVEVINEADERQLVTPTFDPNTGEASFAQAQLPKGFRLAKETAQDKREADTEAQVERATRKTRASEAIKVASAGEKKALGAAIRQGEKAFEKLEPLKKNIANIDKAIAAIDAGAQTGAIQSRLPSIRAASVELDNVRNRLGLDVVGLTTFGALSKGELDLALDTALPTKLSPPQLRDFLVRKKAAQEKLAAQIEDAASFMSAGTGTITQYIDSLKAVEQDAAQELSIDDLVSKYAN